MKNKKIDKEIIFPDGFMPDKELIDFADWFSKHYFILSEGDYYSANNKYHIIFKDPIIDENVYRGYMSDFPKFFSVGHVSGKIAIDRKLCLKEKFSNDCVFYLIMWCIVKKEIVSFKETTPDDDTKLADSTTLNYFIKSGRPKSTIKDLYSWMAQYYTSELNNQRFDLILKNIAK